MAYTFEKITEIDMEEWMKLFNQCYTSMVGGNNFHFPANVSKPADRKLGMYKHCVNFISHHQNIVTRVKDSEGKVIGLMFGWKNPIDDIVYSDIVSLFGKDYTNSKSYIYSDEFSDAICEFLKSEGFTDIRIRVPEDSKADKSLESRKFKLYKHYCRVSYKKDEFSRVWRQYDSKLY